MFSIELYRGYTCKSIERSINVLQYYRVQAGKKSFRFHYHFIYHTSQYSTIQYQDKGGGRTEARQDRLLYHHLVTPSAMTMSVPRMALVAVCFTIATDRIVDTWTKSRRGNASRTACFDFEAMTTTVAFAAVATNYFAPQSEPS